MSLLYWSAITVGFFGSFHCIGMCGPIAMALPSVNNNKTSMIAGRLFYNAGRVLTYSLLGLIAGLAGHTFSMRGWQSDISIIAGILIILFVLFSSDKVVNYFSSKLVGFSFYLKKYFGVLVKKHSYSSLFSIGLLNGILPCGSVYLALAGATTAGTPASGMLYMAVFGLGTLPMMFILSMTGSAISIKSKNVINKFSPLIAIGLALFLIQRGSMMRHVSPDSCTTMNTHVIGCTK